VSHFQFEVHNSDQDEDANTSIGTFCVPIFRSYTAKTLSVVRFMGSKLGFFAL